MRDCPECERLWQDYGYATHHHIAIIGKRRIAQLQRNKESERDLDAKVKAAEKARKAARNAIREHEAVLHGETADRFPE